MYVTAPRRAIEFMQNEACSSRNVTITSCRPSRLATHRVCVNDGAAASWWGAVMSGRRAGRVYIARSPEPPEPVMTTTADIDQDHDAPDPELDAKAAASLRAVREWPITAGAHAGVSQADGNTQLRRALRALFRP